MRSLHVSLGHNSSACLAVDGVVTRGYEQERVDRRKSSSAYPRGAIALALADHRPSPVDVAYVSHWFDDFDLPNGPNQKYLDYPDLAQRVGEVRSLSPEFTHHDAHAGSAVSFAHGHGINGPAMVVVADGFGNLQECLSAYHLQSNGRLDRFHRTYGYANSLGLMYQYTTEALGLRPNQDEYKLLGYEARILQDLHRDVAMQVRAKVADAGVEHARAMLEATRRPDPVPGQLFDNRALLEAKSAWFDQVGMWHSMMPDDRPPTSVRPFIAFCAQTFLEAAMVEAIRRLLPAGVRQIVLAGGCFYNVKLTREVMLATNCRVFAHPLAGDQGAALGMGDAPALLSLCVGDRGIAWRTVAGDRTKDVWIVDEDRWPDLVADLLSQNRVVNLVRGSMEYGPRALCNTSTLALPTPGNVALINSLNERDDAMPMAPVMTEKAARDLLRFDELAMVKGSDRYMIATVAWDGEPPDFLKGVAHPHPTEEGTWTCRPQVITQHSDPWMFDVLSTTSYETLINTSFNYHGEPIVMTMDDALRTHDKQAFRAKTTGAQPPATVMVLS